MYDLYIIIQALTLLGFIHHRGVDNVGLLYIAKAYMAHVLSIEIEPRFFKLRRGRLYTIQNPLIFCIILQQISRKDYDLQEALSRVRVLSKFVYIFIITDMSARQRTSDMGRVAQKTVGYLPKGFLHVNYLVNNLVTYQGGKCREVNYLL